MKITKEAPPRTNKRVLDHEEIVIELKNSPTEWHRLPDLGTDHSTRSLAHQITKGKVAAYRPTGAFEAVSRKGEDGIVHLWARFVGKPARKTPARKTRKATTK